LYSSGIAQLIECDIMRAELNSEVSVRDCMEFVGYVAAHTEEIAMHLFGVIPNYCLIRMNECSICASLSLLVVGSEVIVSLIFVFEEEIGHAHFGVHALVS